MKKILVNFLYWGTENSGIFRSAYKIIEELSKICEDKIFVITNKNFYLDKITIIKVKTLNFKSIHFLQSQFYLNKLIKEIKPDLIFNPFHVGYLFKINSPQISIIYDIIPILIYNKRIDTYLYHKLILKKLINKCTFVVTPSKVTKNELIQLFKAPKEKINVVYLGIDKEKFKPLNIPKENFYLIVNATFPYKNVDYVIKLWKKFDIKENLIIVGHHPKYLKYHNYLKNLTKKLNLEDKIIFYPKVTDEELVELYNKAIALISPSLKEGFGLPPLEALACGTPVILSDIPVYREIYNDIAIFFDLNNDESFLFALEKLKNLNKDEFENKRKEFIKKFDWNKTAEEIYKIIKDAV